MIFLLKIVIVLIGGAFWNTTTAERLKVKYEDKRKQEPMELFNGSCRDLLGLGIIASTWFF